MTNQSTQKIKSFKIHKARTSWERLAIILVIFGLILAAAAYLGVRIKTGQNIIKREKVVNLSTLLEKENKKLEMPEGFPKDIPIVEPDNVSQAYIRDQKTKDITLAIESKKSVKENFDYYLDYGKKNGWQIDEARDTTGKLPGKLLLRKDNLIVTIAIEAKQGGGSKITLSSTSLNSGVLKNIDIKSFKLE